VATTARTESASQSLPSCIRASPRRSTTWRPIARLSDLLEATVSENIVSLINFLEGGTSVDDLDATSATLAYSAPSPSATSRCPRVPRLSPGLAMFVAQWPLRSSPISDSAQHLPLAQRLLGRSVDSSTRSVEQVGKTYEPSAISGSATAAGYDSIG